MLFFNVFRPVYPAFVTCCNILQMQRDCELEALFIEPSCTRMGYGSALLEDAKQRLKKLGVRRLIIQSDPNAEPFYLALGASRIGSRASASIPRRRLPLFALHIS